MTNNIQSKWLEYTTWL